MNITGKAIRHPPSFCSAQLFRFGVPIWRPRRSLMRTVRDAVAMPGSGMVQAGVCVRSAWVLPIKSCLVRGSMRTPSHRAPNYPPGGPASVARKK